MDFASITEQAGTGATAEQIDRLLDRSFVAASVSDDARVLDVACGSGAGIGAVKSVASSVLAGDITMSLLGQARSHYGDVVPLINFDAQRLPFADGSFDTVLILEAIYYLPDVPAFLTEVRRVLGQAGKLLVSTVNPEWDEFVPSAHSTRYYALSELAGLLESAGFTSVKAIGAFSTVPPPGVRSGLARLLRRAGRLMKYAPKTLHGREVLKKLLYGPLTPLPPEVELGGYAPKTHEAIDATKSCTSYKILYVIASVGP
jgi:SAM-dependent methyltransferase